MKDVVTWLIIEVYFIQLQDWGGELLKAIGEPKKAGRGERWPGTSETSNHLEQFLYPPGDKKGSLLCRASGNDGHKKATKKKKVTQPEQGDLSGLSVRVKLAHMKGWFPQAGTGPWRSSCLKWSQVPSKQWLRGHSPDDHLRFLVHRLQCWPAIRGDI